MNLFDFIRHAPSAPFSAGTTPLHPVGNWLRAALPPFWAAAANLVIALAAIGAVLGATAIVLVWLERKLCAHFQARLGPMRVGPHGVLQPLADGIKLLLKESIQPRGVDRLPYYLAPMLPMAGSFLILAVLPFGPTLQAVDVDAGMLYIATVSGLGILGILVGGWASNSKYSLLGAMRSGAQLLSYELSMVLCMLLVVAAAGTASLRGIVLSQQGTVLDWWIFKLPVFGFLAFVLYMISSTAELNRGPFDLSEAESELAGGFHTEYTGITFSLFFMSEYVNLFASAGLAATFFLGGFLPPNVGIHAVDAALGLVPGWTWFLLKAYALVFLYMWLRWSMPRLRIDHLLALEWKVLLPASMINLLLASGLIAIGWVLP